MLDFAILASPFSDAERLGDANSHMEQKRHFAIFATTKEVLEVMLGFSSAGLASPSLQVRLR